MGGSDGGGCAVQEQKGERACGALTTRAGASGRTSRAAREGWEDWGGQVCVLPATFKKCAAKHRIRNEIDQPPPDYRHADGTTV